MPTGETSAASNKLKKMAFLFTLFLALSLCSFAAQYQTEPQKSQKETKGKTVSVTGCLQKGDQEGEFAAKPTDVVGIVPRISVFRFDS